MKRKSIILIFILLVLAVILFILIFYQFHSSLKSPNVKEVCINQKCFNVGIANTHEERATGLMYVKQLDEDSGMLFIFDDEGIYSFWMKNTIIPLDMIWINQSQDIVFIAKNETPCSETCPLITPDKPAEYVLEVNAGISDGFNFSIGDKVEFNS